MTIRTHIGFPPVCASITHYCDTHLHAPGNYVGITHYGPLRHCGITVIHITRFRSLVAVIELTQDTRSSLSPRSLAAAIRRRSLGNEPFPIETGCQGSRPPEAARLKGAPLTGHFNRNFRLQEIDGELRRLVGSEPAAGRGRGLVHNWSALSLDRSKAAVIASEAWRSRDRDGRSLDRQASSRITLASQTLAAIASIAGSPRSARDDGGGPLQPRVGSASALSSGGTRRRPPGTPPA